MVLFKQGAPRAGPATSEGKRPGDASERAHCLAILTPFTAAVVGPEKKRHSNLETPSCDNNVILAAASVLWPGRVIHKEFPGRCALIRRRTDYTQ